MSAGPNRILIVDDDEGARYVKSRLLQRQGYIVSEASLGRDAVVLAETEKPHLALLDVKLPDVSGIEVCREIKSLYPSKRLSAGRRCRLVGPGWPAGSCPRIPVF
jgi:CheY-like chemotaxis protein